METVVGDISRGIEQHKNLSDVILERCCGELTRGVVDGIVVNQCIQTFALQTAGKTLCCFWYLYQVCSLFFCMYWVSSGAVLCKEEELIQKSLENTKNYSKNLKDLKLTLQVVSWQCMASVVCGCFQSGTVERIEVEADCVEVRVHYK